MTPDPHSDTLSFTIRDPHGHYSISQITHILDACEICGLLPDHADSIQHLTVRQLDHLLRHEYDA